MAGKHGGTIAKSRIASDRPGAPQKKALDTRLHHHVEVCSVKNPHAFALGKLGGSKGGYARAKKLTPARRSEIASKAARTRWKTGERVPPRPPSKYDAIIADLKITVEALKRLCDWRR